MMMQLYMKDNTKNIRLEKEFKINGWIKQIEAQKVVNGMEWPTSRGILHNLNDVIQSNEQQNLKIIHHSKHYLKRINF